MTEVETHTVAPSIPSRRSAAYIVQWLRELEECRCGGLITDEEYALERAEKLSELLCRHRRLWLAPIVAAGSLGAVAGSAVWMIYLNWQLTGLAAAMAALVGLIMLAHPCRESMKHTQIRERLEILNNLLELDLVTADEFLVYEERLHGGEGELRVVGNF